MLFQPDWQTNYTNLQFRDVQWLQQAKFRSECGPRNPDLRAILATDLSEPIRALALPAISVQIADRQELQCLLLNGPHQIDLWLQLDQSSRGEQEQESPPKPLAVVARQLATSRTKPAAQARATSPSASSSQDGIFPGAPRPIQQRFHPAGSSEAQAVLQEQLAELQVLVQERQYEAVLERLGLDMVEPRATKLPAAATYGLGHWAYEQERFEVAAPLLASVVAEGDQAGELLPWAQLFLGLSCRGLGEIGRAKKQLNDLKAKHLSRDASFHAQLALECLGLSTGAAVDERDFYGYILSTFQREDRRQVQQMSQLLFAIKSQSIEYPVPDSGKHGLSDSLGLFYSLDGRR